jgi:N-acyl-phosphatidylethanolamine-hydrolysing phospholipase D
MSLRLPRARRALLALTVVVIAGAAAGCSSLGTFAAISWRNVGVFFQSPRPSPFLERRPQRDGAQLAVTWVGHATVLIQIADRFILTDPVFTEFVGGVQRRLVAPGLLPGDLPHIDAVIVSHMHLDHLSVGSLEQIAGKVATVIAPSKSNRYVPDLGYRRVELAPWNSVDLEGLRVTAVPVRHNGRRFGFDSGMRDACAGFVVEYAGQTIYFGGDQGYSAAYNAQIAARFPSIDLTLLPIGPVAPAALFRQTHLDPAEAVQTLVDINAAAMVPMHYDTFTMSPTDETGVELKLLAQALESRRDIAARVRVLRIGEVAILAGR